MTNPKNKPSGLHSRPQLTPQIVPESSAKSPVRAASLDTALSVDTDAVPGTRELLPTQMARPIVEVSPELASAELHNGREMRGFLPTQSTGPIIVEMSPDVTATEPHNKREMQEFLPTQSAGPIIVEMSPDVTSAEPHNRREMREFLPTQSAGSVIVEMSPDVTSIEVHEAVEVVEVREVLPSQVSRPIVEVAPDIAASVVEKRK